MAWLITHMWMTLAAAGVLGLIFGWTFRGAMMLGRMRRADVNRDLALTELEQTKSENEELWVAQRSGATAAAGAGDEALKAELEARELRMTKLSEELAASKAELDLLRQDRAETPDDAPVEEAGATEAAPERLDDNIDEEEASLVWRNRHLESRVRHLEGKLHELAGAGAVAADAAAIVDEAVDDTSSAAAEGDASPAIDTAEHDKLVWRADYLSKRVAFLETQIGNDTAIETEAVAPIVEDVAETPAAETEVVGDAGSDDDGEGATNEEELASLRWRNRYLEGRLAYYEGETEAQTAVEAIVDEVRGSVTEQVDEANESILSDIAPTELSQVEDPISKEEVDEAVAAVGAAVAAGADALDPRAADEERLADTVADVATEPAPEAEDDTADAPKADSEIVIEESVADAENPTALEKPLALDGPVAGQADDLTVIGGVGPKIQEVLNELGIYHYDQIAAWSLENMAWVDDHLSFSGRIMRERWVEQAKVLVDDSE